MLIQADAVEAEHVVDPVIHVDTQPQVLELLAPNFEPVQEF